MNKTSTIALVVFFTLIVVALLVYGFVFVPKKGTGTIIAGSGAGGGNVNPTPTGPTHVAGVLQSDLEKIALHFRERFSSSTYASNRCPVISDMNRLSISQLTAINTYYKTSFGLSLKEEMDGAWIWCASNDVDNQLYDKIKNL